MNLIEWPYYQTEFLASQGLSPTFLKRFWEKVNKDGPIPAHRHDLGPCWMWTGYAPGFGYGLIHRSGHGGAPMRAHVASWIIHYGPIPEGLNVLHKCDNPPCIRPDHLFPGTQGKNIEDMTEKGRNLGLDKMIHASKCGLIKAARGEQAGRSKLTNEQVLKIRELYLNGLSQKSIAEMFKIDTGNTNRIVHRKTWSHI